jgi:hypothetical protein
MSKYISAIMLTILLSSSLSFASENVECEVTDGTIAQAVAPIVSKNEGVNPVESSTNAKVQPPVAGVTPSSGQGSPPPQSSESNAIKPEVKEQRPKLILFGDNPINFDLRDRRFYVQVAHYTGTYQILIFDRAKRNWLVKTTVPDQNFTGMLLENIRPLVKVSCVGPTPSNNSPRKP